MSVCQRCSEETKTQCYPKCFVPLGIFPFEPLLCPKCSGSLVVLLKTKSVSTPDPDEAFDTVRDWFTELETTENGSS